MTVFDLLREIYRQADSLISSEASVREDDWRLLRLRGAVSVLIEVAEQLHDRESYAVLDDLEYACNHIGFVNSKAEVVLREAGAKIESLGKHEGQV